MGYISWEYAIMTGFLFFRDEGKGRITIAKEFYQKNPTNHIELYFGHATNRYATFTGNALNDKDLTDGTTACIRQITAYAREHEAEFVEMVANKSQAEISKSQRDNRRELEQSKKRMEKLDTIIQKLCEDNVEGKISDERFMKMSASYEDEQKSLKTRISELKCEIATDKENSLNVNHFLDLVKRYTEVPELTAEIIREFIEKVFVYHPEKINGQKTQRVRIIWNCIGEIPTQNKTA